MRDFLSLVSSPSPSYAWEKRLRPLKKRDDASRAVALLERGPMLKRHFLIEKPLHHSVEEVSHPLRTTVKPDASNGVMEDSVAVKAVKALHLPACSRGPAAKGVSPIRALCRRYVAPASHDRMDANDSVAVKAVSALHLLPCCKGPAAGGGSPITTKDVKDMR